MLRTSIFPVTCKSFSANSNKTFSSKDSFTGEDFAYTNVHGKVVSDINQFNFGHQNPGKIFPNYEDVAEVLDVVKCQYEKTFQLLEVLPTKSQNNPL